MKTAYEQVLAYLDSTDRSVRSRQLATLKHADSLGIEFNSENPIPSIDTLIPREFNMPQHIPISELHTNQIYCVTHDQIPKSTKYIWKTNNGNIFFSTSEPTKNKIKFLTYEPGNDLIIGPKQQLTQVDSPKVKFQLNNQTMAMYLSKN